MKSIGIDTEVARFTSGHDRLVTRQETSEILGVCLRTVDRRADTGELVKRYVGKGRSVRFLLSNVLRLVGIELESSFAQP